MGRKGGGGMRIKQMGPTKEQRAMMKEMQAAQNGEMKNPMDEFMIPPDQMINLPPTPDRNYKMFWPMHETFSMDPSTFFVIYPSYMDSLKTMKQGRRIGKEVAVDTPIVNDISEALQTLQIRHVLEPYKGYSRDPTTLWDNPGRVKVEPQQPTYTKRSLLIELSSIITTLPSRVRRLEVIAAVKEAKEAKRLQVVAEKQLAVEQQKKQQQKSNNNSNKSNNKSSRKKGKKKR